MTLHLPHSLPFLSHGISCGGAYPGAGYDYSDNFLAQRAFDFQILADVGDFVRVGLIAFMIIGVTGILIYALRRFTQALHKMEWDITARATGMQEQGLEHARQAVRRSGKNWTDWVKTREEARKWKHEMVLDKKGRMVQRRTAIEDARRKAAGKVFSESRTFTSQGERILFYSIVVLAIVASLLIAIFVVDEENIVAGYYRRLIHPTSTGERPAAPAGGVIRDRRP